MLGRKTGGRQKGTPNRRTQEAQQILAELGCDPIEGMARIATDESNSAELRGRMLAELAQYAYPKRKAVEVTEVWNGDLATLTEAQLSKLLEQLDTASPTSLRASEAEMLKRLATADGQAASSAPVATGEGQNVN